MHSNNQDSPDSSAKPTRQEIEKRMLDEAQRMVDYLEQALKSAPDDERLRARLEEITLQARSLRDRIVQALSQRAADQGEG